MSRSSPKWRPFPSFRVPATSPWVTGPMASPRSYTKTRRWKEPSRSSTHLRLRPAPRSPHPLIAAALSAIDAAPGAPPPPSSSVAASCAGNFASRAMSAASSPTAALSALALANVPAPAPARPPRSPAAPSSIIAREATAPSATALPDDGEVSGASSEEPILRKRGCRAGKIVQAEKARRHQAVSLRSLILHALLLTRIQMATTPQAPPILAAAQVTATGSGLRLGASVAPGPRPHGEPPGD
jgi:hypothetical protein